MSTEGGPEPYRPAPYSGEHPTTDDPAEDAVREKLHQTFGYMVTSELCRTTARVAVEAARPIIEAPLRVELADCQNRLTWQIMACDCGARAAVRTEPEQ